MTDNYRRKAFGMVLAPGIGALVAVAFILIVHWICPDIVIQGNPWIPESLARTIWNNFTGFASFFIPVEIVLGLVLIVTSVLLRRTINCALFTILFGILSTFGFWPVLNLIFESRWDMTFFFALLIGGLVSGLSFWQFFFFGNITPNSCRERAREK